jgi:hypothetical protein
LGKGVQLRGPRVLESCALQLPQNPPHDPKNEGADRDSKQYSEHRADHFALPAAVIAASAGAAKILGRISHLRMKAVTTMNRSSQSKRHPLHFLTEGTTMKYQEGAPLSSWGKGWRASPGSRASTSHDPGRHRI